MSSASRIRRSALGVVHTYEQAVMRGVRTVATDLYEQACELVTRSVGIAQAATDGHVEAFDYEDAEAAFLALEQILDLHAPDERGECEECRCEHGFPDSLTWPCNSAQVVLSSLGLSPVTEERC
jgi:hypothetical protein